MNAITPSSLPSVPVGAGASPSVTTHNQQHTSSRTDNTHIGNITVVTRATDAHSMAADLREAMRRDVFARSQEGGLV